MGSESCRWDSHRAFCPMVPALPRARSVSVGASSRKPDWSSVGQACLPTAVGVNVLLLTPPRIARRTLPRVGSKSSG